MSIIRDIEIARAAGFAEHPVEAKAIEYTHNKETSRSQLLIPCISWTPAGGGLADNGILSNGRLLYFSSDGNMLNSSLPYTSFKGSATTKSFEYYRYPRTTYSAPISLSCQRDFETGTDTWTWSDPYADPQEKVATGWAADSVMIPEILQGANTINYDNDLKCWYCSVKFVFYRDDPADGWIYVGGSSLIHSDTIQLDPAGYDFLNFITTKNALTAQT